MRPSSRTIFATFAAALLSIEAWGFPKPAPVPYRWELQFEPGELRLYQDPDGGSAYWFMTYKITNRTGRQQVWAPGFTLFTDAGEILPAGRDVPAPVTDKLVELLANPLLETQNQIIGEVEHGRENAREGLAVWPARNLQVNQISLFISGMSGETASVENPVSGERVLLRKTLQRDYLISGDAAPRGSRPVPLVSQTWVMR